MKKYEKKMPKSLEDMFKSTTFAPAFERERRTRHDDEGKAEEAVTLKYKDEVGDVNHISDIYSNR